MRHLLPILLLASIVAACGGSVAPTPVPATPRPTPQIAAGAGPSIADPSALASESAAPALAGSSPEASPADADLEQQIPATVQGLPIEVVSLPATDYLAQSPDSRLATLIEDAHVEPTAVTVAIGIGRSATVQLAIAAFRFPGVDERLLGDLFARELTAGVAGVTMEPMEVGGHEVMLIADPTQPGAPTFLIVEGDLARIVQATDVPLAKAAVGALP